MKISITKASKIKEVLLTSDSLTLEEFIAVAKYHAKVLPGRDCLEKVRQGRACISSFLEEGRILYGITTGFGDNVKYTISPEDAAVLQKNILLSHSVSVGDPLGETEVRAILFMILLNNSQGFSGLSEEVFLFLCDLLNRDCYPYAPQDGSVGYLAPEAHICLTIIGEGYFLEDGKKIPARSYLPQKGLSPLTLQCKEGLSLITGTTSSTALGLLALYEGLCASQSMEIINALIYESLKGTLHALHPQIHELKKHKEQQQAAQTLLSLLKDSSICQAYLDAKVQDACLLRTMPQITGACMRTFHQVHETLMEELHSCSDNPVVIVQKDGSARAFMTGNFDGTYVASACDFLTIAFANLGNLIERSTDRLLNHHLSDGLPPFLVSSPGLNSGYMITQYTQAGLMNQLKLLSAPASVDSITTCAGQEDPVSMAYNAAKKSLQASHILTEMTAIQLMNAVQAIDFTTAQTGLSQSPILQSVHDYVREQIPFLKEDRYLHQDILLCQDIISSCVLIELTEKQDVSFS